MTGCQQFVRKQKITLVKYEVEVEKFCSKGVKYLKIISCIVLLYMDELSLLWIEKKKC